MSPANRISLQIDGRLLQVEKGLTILQAARQNGIDIPTLCDFPGLRSPGSCRMCIVEIQGRPNTPTACTTPAEEGMVIATHSPKVESLRAEILQLLLAEHPSGCLYCAERGHCQECMVTLRKAGVTTGCGSCPKDGQCELQALAVQYEITKPVYPIHYRMLPVEKHDPFFDRDNNLCILCGRCIRVCEDLHFDNTLTYIQRGTHALVGTAFQRTHLESSCTFCGSCVEVCPTGALSEKTRKWDGAPEGVTATTCPLCAIGCQINLLTKQENVIGSLPNRAAGTDILCVKGRFGIPELVNPVTRLKRPEKRADGFRQAIGWDEAVRIAAEKLASCPSERFGMRISASSTNEDLYMAYQFACRVMKSGNIRTSAWERYGSGLETIARLLQDACSLEMLAEAGAILCLGLEDRYADSAVEVHLNRAKKRGAKIVYLGTNELSWSARSDEWQRAANMLQQAESPVIILGPAALSHPQNQALLQTVETLVRDLSARVIALPDPANLVGALRLGLDCAGSAPEDQDLDVLYLIGEAVPPLPAHRPFVLYQNPFPPAGLSPAGLLLPASAFTEEEGTLVDYAGQVKAVHPAVPPCGEARPTWMILSQIARQMGAPGFDYNCVEDIWRAAQADFPGFPEMPSRAGAPFSEEGAAAAITASSSPSRSGPPYAHAYMGYSLVERVAGLRSLYPEKTNGSTHEPHS